ncbi:uncharacterized protein LOC131894591 isoform X1 [Peromyscus eremicus]|uniref:uncharacterized protein LOC131894591 isoform X1 n=1 Tax=Peromyscus eremicus TaxID=42410 RepID=UPI0027DD8E45|nr:uncharacterized protein LOC131894591 isoform X1 [Peromyscus eremicus]
MQKDTDHGAQTPTPSASEQAHWTDCLWTFCQGCGSHEQSEDEYPPHVIQLAPLEKVQRAPKKSTVKHFTTSRGHNVDEHDRKRRSHEQSKDEYPPYVIQLEPLEKVQRAPKKSTVKRFTTSRGHNVNEHDRRRSKGTSAKEPEQRNKEHVRLNREVHHSTDPKSFFSEERHPGELQLIPEKPVQISTVNAGTEQKTPISKGTSANDPEQRNKKHVRFNTEVQHSTDPKPFCNEERHPGELQSILKKPVQISTVNAGTEQKTPISKGTSAKEPEQRNKKLVRVNTEVQHSTDPKPFCNEERHPGELQSILKKPVQISTVNAGTEQKTPVR